MQVLAKYDVAQPHGSNRILDWRDQPLAVVLMRVEARGFAPL
jgi:hypothetical protein